MEKGADVCEKKWQVFISGMHLLRFEPQLLSHRLPVKVYVLRADLVAFYLSEGSQRIGDCLGCDEAARRIDAT